MHTCLQSRTNNVIGFASAHRLADNYACFYIVIGIDSSPSSSRPVHGRLDHPAKYTTTTRFFTMFVFNHVYYAIKLWVTTVSSSRATVSLHVVHLH
uniref:Uncharacterized protein n=1 Tax=Leersia perrieri TaxID=77586 RepID=A0A0D9Y1S2_9ORYZ